MNDFDFKNFTENDVQDMRSVFNEAFSDYSVAMHLSSKNFQKKIVEKTAISFSHSIGCQINKKWIGFIFNSINQYENKSTAYNGGTGVVPEFRGNNLTEKMYDNILPFLITEGVKQCVLEVIADNTPALKAYRKVGFRKSKYLHCLKASGDNKYLDKHAGSAYDIHSSKNPDWQKYKTFCDFNPSYIDTLEMLERNRKNETSIELKKDGELLGFLIFNKNMGRIGHIGVHPDYRGKRIGTALVNHARKVCDDKQLYVLNINEKSYGILNFFLRLGFINELDQFELKLKIG